MQLKNLNRIYRALDDQMLFKTFYRGRMEQYPWTIYPLK